MQEKVNQTELCMDDEIDLRELLKTILQNKIKIIVITLSITILATVYVLFKNPTPIYSGHVMVEIGEVKSDSEDLIYFDKANNLKSIIDNKFNTVAEIPKGTTNIIIPKINNTDKTKIIQSLKNVVSYIIDRHKEKTKLYDKYIMTKQIGNITIDEQPINLPKKKLIITVAFVTGLILSIFLVFFLEFIKGFKEEEKAEG